jgi:hypothetical protein
LFAGYGLAALVIWTLYLVRSPAIRAPDFAISRPWLELGLLVAAVATVIGVGQLYSAGFLLDKTNLVTESLNQLAIFSPVLLVLAVRPQPFRSAYLAREAVLGGPIGVILALLALGAYAAARQMIGDYTEMLRFLVHPSQIPHLVQVVLEDVAIAAFLSRFAAALGPRKAIALVAALFAAAHIPAMLTSGVGLASMTPLVLDTLLGVLVLGAVVTTRSIWWFIPIHFALDVIQFYKSKFSEKWWMEVPYPDGRERYSRNSIVPCSYNDYQTAIKGEVPERYISTLAKLI